MKVSITGYANDAIQSVIEEGPIDNFTFYNARALHNLLSVIAVDSDYENQDNLQLDDDETLSSQDVREIIEIFRHKAISCNDDILRSFDYLSYARLMAIIINDTRLAATLKAHKDILLLHNHYAKNKSLFAEDIERITQQAPDSLYISRMAQRLKIVASLCQTENNAWLWDIVNKSNNETEKELAQMVLSHNLLYEMNHEDTTPAKIKDKIAKKLNVNSEQRNLKYYGSESQYVEFKSSLVYPAQKGKSGISKADPDKQEFEILHIIAGFLNTTGGTLYIGVSDDHYEHGLDDDFTYYRMDTSEKNNKYRRNIKSLDNAANYLQNLIDSSFNLGKNIGDYAKAAIDEESVKGVIAVKIDPCPHIVYLDNTIYTRHSAKTEPLIRKDEIELFIADRERLYKQLVAAAYSQDESAETHTKTEIDTPSQTINDTKDNDDSYADEQNQFSVKTSKIRKNILHEYNDPDHFVTPLCYIRFVDEDNYIVTQDEWSIEPESDRLVLTITEEEVEEYLLLVYEGEYAIKVKMKEVINKEGKGKLPHYTDRKLIFACPLSTNGGLYSLHSNNKNTLYERITPTDKISQGSLNSVPERIMDIDSIITVLWEIVSPDKMNEMSSIYSTTMKRTQIGALVKGSSSIKTSIEEAEKAILNKLS